MTDPSPPTPGLPATKADILIVPDPALRARAKPVGAGDWDRVRALVPGMFAAMYDAPGIGLAAPQVGVGLRVVVIDLQPDDRREPLVLVNPAVTHASPDTARREEGCLSIPGHYADVTRPARIRVRYQDLDGAVREIEGGDLLSACLQHEIDHLDGVLFVDHLSPLKRNMILRKMAKRRRSEA